MIPDKKRKKIGKNSTCNIAILLPAINGGGAERVASILSKYFIEQKYRVFILVNELDRRRDYSFAGKIIPINIKRISYTNGELGNLWQDMVMLIKKSIRVRQIKKKLQITHSISFMEEFNLINILSRYRDQTYIRVCTILSERKEELKGMYYNRSVLKFFYNKAAKTIVMTEYAKQDMVKHYGIKRENIWILPNPFKSGEYETNSLRETEWEYGDKVFVSIARLHEVKQIQHLIRAFSIVARVHGEAKLLLIGSGERKETAYLNMLTKRMQLEGQVFFLGQQKEIAYYLKNSRAFVLTSKTEGFPNSMLEALAYGVPVISVDCPGAPREILAPGSKNTGCTVIEHAKYGVLVPAMDGRKYCAKDALIKQEKLLGFAMQEMLGEKIYEQYHNAAKEYVKQYSIEKIGRDWELLLGIKPSYR